MCALLVLSARGEFGESRPFRHCSLPCLRVMGSPEEILSWVERSLARGEWTVRQRMPTDAPLLYRDSR
jgi:hypothetical protein